ncbi:hypothetical protein C8R46DRAFT_1189432 [Mycena filopes]|nr:hypothetical protein C8R46DRAFT_1189432 [Mycena filopes]
MPASTRKDRSTIIVVREVPVHLSKDVFESKIKTVLESLMTIPICKKNYVTFDLILETPLLNADIRALGFPEARPQVIAFIECETADQFTEIFSDPEFAKVLAQGEEEFGFCTTASALFFDGVVTLDRPAGADLTTLVGMFNIPAGFSHQEFLRKIEDRVNRFIALPICQKVLVKHSMFLPSTVGENLQGADGMLRAVGLPPPAPSAVGILKFESMNAVSEFLADPDTKKFAMEAEAEFLAHGVGFVADVQPKVVKA